MIYKATGNLRAIQILLDICSLPREPKKAGEAACRLSASLNAVGPAYESFQLFTSSS